MKLEIGCLAMIRFGQTSDDFERHVISQVVGRFVRISGTSPSDSGDRTVWDFEESIAVTTPVGFAALFGVTEKFLIPLAPPGLTEEITTDELIGVEA